MKLGLGGYPPLLVAVRNRVADYGGLPRGPITCSSVHALWARAALPRVQAAPTRAKSYNRDTTTDGDCAAGAPSVCGCALPHASSCLHTPAECLQKKPYTVRPRQCALQVAGPTQSQCHPTQPYTHPIQPHPVRTSLALQTYPALHIILSSPPHLLSSPLLWRGSGAGPSARARWYSCCSSAACCPEAAHRPRRLRQRRAPASRARQTSRRPGAACPTAWPKCENERPLRRSDACPKS